MFYIGNIKIKNPVALAPMAGISNASYIKICEEMGASYAVTELISSEAIIRENKKTFDMLEGLDKLKIPYAIQIFGGNPKNMGLSAKIICEKFNPSIIDINMGCPVPKVAIRSEAGSSLLKNPNLIYEIVKSVVDNVSIPVTVKIRSGWDNFNINAVENAKIIESAGASAICVHPRTRAQGYTGHSDWNIIKKVKESVSIPVIGNGDINNCYDAKKMLEETKCDAIMIGRACIGNPWIIKETINYLEKNELPKKIELKEKIKIIKKHIKYLLEVKPERVVVLEMRMHISKYLKGINGASSINTLINKSKTIKEIYDILNELEDKNV